LTRPAAINGDRPDVSGLAEKMTFAAMGLGDSITAADPTILSANISEVRAGLHMSPSTVSFVASLATLSLAAAVLGAGALGDLYGMRRVFTVGLLGTIGFGETAAAPNNGVLIVARAGTGVAFAFLLGWSLAIINAVFPPERRVAAIALYRGAGFALTTPMPAFGSLLAEHAGWRTGFLVAHGTSVASRGGANVFDPQRAREVVASATASMVDAIHTLSLMMTVVPVAAIVLALVLLRPARRAVEEEY
jgi:MFS family permease